MPDARELYGVTNDQPASAVEWNEHAVINGVAGKKIFIVNSDGSQVNPANTINQDTLNSLIETLQELTQRLMPLAGAMSNAVALRVAPISSVSTAVTGSVTATGGGYITSAQSIAEKAVAGVSYPEKIAITNSTAIQSNINNVTV
jgi:hypothetical protein